MGRKKDLIIVLLRHSPNYDNAEGLFALNLAKGEQDKTNPAHDTKI